MPSWYSPIVHTSMFHGFYFPSHYWHPVLFFGVLLFLLCGFERKTKTICLYYCNKGWFFQSSKFFPKLSGGYCVVVQRHRERRTHKKRTPIWLNVWVGRWRDGPSLETIGLVEGAPRTTAGSISSGGWSTGHFRDIPGYI